MVPLCFSHSTRCQKQWATVRRDSTERSGLLVPKLQFHLPPTRKKRQVRKFMGFRMWGRRIPPAASQPVPVRNSVCGYVCMSVCLHVCMSVGTGCKETRTGGAAARGGARTAGGWFVCTSTEPSWRGSTRPGAVPVSHQRLLSSGHMARVCLEAPSDVSSTEPLCTAQTSRW